MAEREVTQIFGITLTLVFVDPNQCNLYRYGLDCVRSMRSRNDKKINNEAEESDEVF